MNFLVASSQNTSRQNHRGESTMSYAYQATIGRDGLKNFIVNCYVDKLVFMNMDSQVGDRGLPKTINWSSINKFSVGQLSSCINYTTGTITREYHLEYMAPIRFQTFKSTRELSFSITDKRQGSSLLFDAIQLGCLAKMNPRLGVFLWEIFESNPAVANLMDCTIFTGPGMNIGPARYSGSSLDRQRMNKLLKDNIGCPMQFSAGEKYKEKTFTESILGSSRSPSSM